MKILSWNVNGLGPRRVEVQNLVTLHNPDILLLQETWLKPQTVYNVPGYTVYRKDRHPGRRGGVAALIKNDLTHEELRLDLGKTEAAVVRVNCGGREVNICSAYFPGRTTRKKDIFELEKLKPNALIAGDLNAKNEIWGSTKTDQLGKYIEQLCTQKGFTIHVPSEPTRRSNKINEADSTIDYGLTTDNCNEIEIEVLTDNGTTSDHLPILITAEFGKIESSKAEIRMSTNWEKVANDLNNRPWIETGDVNYDINHFTSSTQAAILNHSKGIKLKDRSHLLLPHKLKEKMEEKRKAVRTYYKYKTPENKRKMKTLKREFDQMYNAQVRERAMEEMAKLNDPKLRWMILKKSRPQPPPIPTLVLNGKTARTTKEKAEILGEALQEKFHPISTKQDEEIKRNVEEVYENIDKLIPEEIPIITAEDVKNAIKKAKIKSATGPDGVSYKLLKMMDENVITHIARIFSNILRTRKFPKKWKEASITMLPKAGKPKHLPSSYRPISLLSCLSKIFERCILKFIKTAAIPHQQFGFRPKHSTTHQLTRIIHDTTESINQKWKGAIVSLDIEAAFDKVPHPELIFKLHKQGQPTWLVQLLKSYYTNRSFHIRLLNQISRNYSINAGTAQGAVLSATLYSLYIADMPRLEDLKTYQYADDTAYLTRTHKMSFSITTINDQLQELHLWCENWRTKINPTKSTAIIINGGRKDEAGNKIKIFYGEEEIPIESHFKYLGVIIDQKLSFARHVDSIVATVSTKTASLMRYLHKNKIVNSSTRVNLYQLLILPSITYGFPSWGGISNNQMKRLLALERKWIRICLFLPSSTPKQILYKLAPFKTIFQLRREIAGKMISNIKNHQNPEVKNILKTYHTPGRLQYPLQQWDHSYNFTNSDGED